MSDELRAGLEKAGVARAERHLLLCIGPDCCAEHEGEVIWEYVKRRVRETGLRAMRTKAGCFRICTGGPWLVVYPEGTWYGNITTSRFERILQKHLLRGELVSEWLAAVNDLRARSTEFTPGEIPLAPPTPGA